MPLKLLKGKRAHAEAVVLEIEVERVLTRRERVRALPADPLQVDQVPQEHRLALQQIEAVATEAAALGHDHPVRAALRDLHVGLEVVRRVEDEGRVAVRRAGELAGPGELVAPGSIRLGRGVTSRVATDASSGRT
jgi:hypothetical protein